jgi:beta-lactam-binding protein with PASTA domain
VFKFITDRPFWVNLLTAMAIALSLIFIFVHLLSWVTKHGQHLTVPAVVGQKTNDAIKLLDDEGFNVVIQDSVYTDTLARGTIIKQLPDPNATVKVNRTVYITVNCEVPPMLDMPKLTGLTLGFALDMLQKSHLQLGDTIYRPDFMKGSILEQKYNGSSISPGAKIQWGSKITLVVGGGLEESNIVVPDLVGMRYGVAKLMLDSMGVMPVPVLDGTVTADDIENAFVIKQDPSHLDDMHQLVYIKPGMVMDVWVSKDMVDLSADSTKDAH